MTLSKPENPYWEKMSFMAQAALVSEYSIAVRDKGPNNFFLFLLLTLFWQ